MTTGIVLTTVGVFFLQHQRGDFLYDGISKLLEEHLTKQCEEKIVPAFPPGGLLSLPPGIVLPQQRQPLSSSSRANIAAGSTSSSGKGKGKARAMDEELPSSAGGSGPAQQHPQDMDLASDTNTGGIAVISSGQSLGDKTDAVARAQAGERLLKAIRDVWEDHCACTDPLSKVLNYVVSRDSLSLRFLCPCVLIDPSFLPGPGICAEL